MNSHTKKKVAEEKKKKKEEKGMGGGNWGIRKGEKNFEKFGTFFDLDPPFLKIQSPFIALFPYKSLTSIFIFSYIL